MNMNQQFVPDLQTADFNVEVKSVTLTPLCVSGKP